MFIVTGLSKMVKVRSIVCFVFLCAAFNSGFSQEMSKKELKEQEKIQKEKSIADLIEGRTYAFVARSAIANGGRTVDLTSNQNFIKFSADMVDSSMPFFGQATGSGHYGASDAGLNFKGSPENYSVDKKKKNYRIRMEVKDSNDSYRINLSVGFEGNSTVTITSNRKSVMTYNGRISKD